MTVEVLILFLCLSIVEVWLLIKTDLILGGFGGVTNLDVPI